MNFNKERFNMDDSNSVNIFRFFSNLNSKNKGKVALAFISALTAGAIYPTFSLVIGSLIGEYDP
jgi:hypothetical protein